MAVSPHDADGHEYEVSAADGIERDRDSSDTGTDAFEDAELGPSQPQDVADERIVDGRDAEQPDQVSTDVSANDDANTSDGSGSDAGDPVASGNSTSPKSGERIQAMVLNAEDGARHHLGWYDTELGLRCAFVPDENGTYRCMPTWGAANVLPYYTDPNCQNRVAHRAPSLGSGACIAQYALEWKPSLDSPDCALAGQQLAVLYSLGVKLGPDDVLYVLTTDGECVESGPPPSAEGYYSAGPKAPATSFVPANLEIVPATP